MAKPHNRPDRYVLHFRRKSLRVANRVLVVCFLSLTLGESQEFAHPFAAVRKGSGEPIMGLTSKREAPEHGDKKNPL
jgi:hypothetical protein